MKILLSNNLIFEILFSRYLIYCFRGKDSRGAKAFWSETEEWSGSGTPNSLVFALVSVAEPSKKPP